MSRATKTITDKKSLVVLQREEALPLLGFLGEKCSITWENPNKSFFLGELLPCSRPACQNSLYFGSFTRLLAEAHLCVFPTVEKQLLSQGLRRLVWHIMLRAERAGNPPDSGTLQPTHRQTQSAASLPASQSFHFFSFFYHLYVNQWLRPKRKIKYRERKQKTLCQKNIPYGRSIS